MIKTKSVQLLFKSVVIVIATVILYSLSGCEQENTATFDQYLKVYEKFGYKIYFGVPDYLFDQHGDVYHYSYLPLGEIPKDKVDKENTPPIPNHFNFVMLINEKEHKMFRYEKVNGLTEITFINFMGSREPYEDYVYSEEMKSYIKFFEFKEDKYTQFFQMENDGAIYHQYFKDEQSREKNEKFLTTEYDEFYKMYWNELQNIELEICNATKLDYGSFHYDKLGFAEYCLDNLSKDFLKKLKEK